MPTSKASAKWAGGLRAGNGEYSAGTGTFSGQYTFATRFEGTKGTNPEELIAAAHAACFSMALAGALEKGGHAPEHISTTAACTVEKVGDGFSITKMHLETRGKVPGIDAAAFQEAAEGAKQNCPVSRALKGNLTVELDAKLEG